MGPRASVGLLLAGVVAGCGADGAPEPAAGCGASSGEAAQAVVGGEVDAGDAAVVALNTLDVDCQRAGAPGCTGTLIGADVVLTAAHCLGEYPPERFAVLLGPTADPGPGELGAGLEGVFFRVVDARVHPGFDASTLANDVALVRLEAAPGVAPAALLDGPLAADPVGEAARVVGYGRAEEAPAYAKRAGTVVITAATTEELVYEAGPSMTCAGDSGGPVFLSVGGEERVVGVTSRGDVACADHGVAIRVDGMAAGFLEGAW